jgi:hypothetical protein
VTLFVSKNRKKRGKTRFFIALEARNLLYLAIKKIFLFKNN